MSIRIIGRSVWYNPGNRGQRVRRLFTAAAWQLYKRTIKRPRTLTLADGVKFRAYPDCVISSALHYAAWPEFAELQFCRRHSRRGHAVLDVGANVGHFSLLLADIVNPEDLYCYEPTPVTWRRLRENFELNRWSTAKVHQLAVGRQEGALEFPDSRSPETTNSAIWRSPDVPKITVRMVSLDSLLPDFDQVRVDILKIDVEGFEPEVFMGGKRFLREVRPRLIMFESLSQEPDAVVTGVLGETGYTIFQLDETGRPVSTHLNAQNLFAAPQELLADFSR